MAAPRNFLVKRCIDRAIDEVPLMSGPAAELLSLAAVGGDPIDMADVAAEHDLLRERLIHAANSNWARPPKRLDSLRDCAVLLGAGRMGMIALFELFRSEALTEPRVQNPSVKVGLQRCIFALAAAESFAAAHHFSRPDAELAASSALLQDIGEIYLAAWFPCPWESVLKEASENGDLEGSERTVLGWTHADLTAYLGERWGMSAGIARLVRCHEGRFEDAAEKEFCVFAAGWLAKCTYPDAKLSQPTEMPAEVLAWLGLERSQIPKMTEALLMQATTVWDALMQTPTPLEATPRRKAGRSSPVVRILLLPRGTSEPALRTGSRGGPALLRRRRCATRSGGLRRRSARGGRGCWSGRCLP